MSVAVAHQPAPTSRKALREGAQEASLRNTSLDVIHVIESLDNDIEAANRAGISDAVETVLGEAGLTDLRWQLHLITAGEARDDVAGAILQQSRQLKSDLLVIGARKRSPVGKAFLGSIAQTVLLEADVPVLVVKGDQDGNPAPA